MNEYALWARVRPKTGGAAVHPSNIPEKELDQYSMLPILNGTLFNKGEFVPQWMYSTKLHPPTHVIVEEEGIVLVHSVDGSACEEMEKL